MFISNSASSKKTQFCIKSKPFVAISQSNLYELQQCSGYFSFGMAGDTLWGCNHLSWIQHLCTSIVCSFDAWYFVLQHFFLYNIFFHQANTFAWYVLLSHRKGMCVRICMIIYCDYIAAVCIGISNLIIQQLSYMSMFLIYIYIYIFWIIIIAFQ